MIDYVPVNTVTNPDYTFLPLYRQQRHLAPGSHASVLVADLFTRTIQEDVWLEVLSCSAEDVYLGRVCAPVRYFAQLPLGEEVYFRPEHVLAVRGSEVLAA